MILTATDPGAIEKAAAALAAGLLVAIPTETVYGLAANALDDVAVDQIFRAKSRPTDHPLIVHVGGAHQAGVFARSIPEMAQRLMQAFWPGPVTVVLPRKQGTALSASGAHDTIALRCPSHPVAKRLLHACVALNIAGLAAPSANRFGKVSATTAAHVEREFGSQFMVLDGGACSIGIESAIIDCTRSEPVLMRPGQLPRHALEEVLGQPLRNPQELAQADPHTPGTLKAHYAPRAKIRLMSAKDLQAGAAMLGPIASQIGVWSRTNLAHIEALNWKQMPEQAQQAAQQLFAVLHDFDDQGIELIWIETPPRGDPQWEGVTDRLNRAIVNK